MLVNLEGYWNKMVSHGRLQEQNGISKEEILQSWKVTKVRRAEWYKEVS
jgi:hypothetical protein